MLGAAQLIFINYRRRDAAGTTGRLYDHLENSFHPDDLFMDVEDIAPGRDFVKMLETEVQRCDVFLAVIGPNWLNMSDSQGRRMLDRENDYVRLEIEVALRLNKLVIPVLVDGGEVPAPSDLPATIRALARRSGIRLSHERFKSDVQQLIEVLKEAVADAAGDKTEQLRAEDIIALHEARQALGKAKSMPTAPASKPSSPLGGPASRPSMAASGPARPGRGRSMSNGFRARRIEAQDTLVDHAGGEPTQAASVPPAGVKGTPSPSSSRAPFFKGLPLSVMQLRLPAKGSWSLPMVSVHGGAFQMGDHAHPSEQPVHTAMVDRFVMMAHPVTRQLYAEVVTTDAPGRGELNVPVNLVSWVEALQFCNRLSAAAALAPAYELREASGTVLPVDAAVEAVSSVYWLPGTSGFRLPTEAEFEYALRAGTQTPYFWGELDASPGRFAWYSDNAERPQPVGQKHPNPWGLFDMAGNVWEWCWDARTEQYDVPGDGATQPVDRRPASLGDALRRVDLSDVRNALQRAVRGGSCIDPAESLRSANRRWSQPGRRLINLGFRCVATPHEAHSG